MDIHNSKDKAIVVLSVIVLIFIVLSVFSGIWDSEKKIKHIKISKAIMMPESDIRDTLMKLIDNKAKSEIDLKLLEEVVLKEKYVKNVELSFAGSSSLKVILTERKPVALLADNSGKLNFFDDEGVILPFTFEYKLDDVFLVNDIYFNKNSHIVLSKISKYIDFLKQDEYRYVKSLVSDFTYDYYYESVVMRTKDHKKILFGDCSSISEKLDNVRTLMKNSILKSDMSGYIDCRWDGMIVLKN